MKNLKYFVMIAIVSLMLSNFLFSQIQKATSKDSLIQIPNNSNNPYIQKIENLENEIRKQQNEITSQHIEIANTIINWSGIILAIFVILFIIAGFLGFGELKGIRKIQKEMNKVCTKARNELNDIKEAKDKIIKEMERFTKITTYLNLGFQLFHLGEYFKARGLLKEAIEIDPNNIQAHNYLGTCYILEEELSNAREEYEKIKEIDENNADAYFGMAMIFYYSNEKKSLEKAIENCLKAIEKDPKHYKALFRLGKLYRLTDKDLALTYLFKAYKIKQGPGISLNIGLVYLAIDDMSEADKFFDEAKYLAKKNVDLFQSPYWEFFILGVIEGLNNELGKAEEFIKKAKSLIKSKFIHFDMKSELDFILKTAKSKKDKENIEKMISWLEY